MSKIRSKLGHWASLHLTYAGKVQLLNSAIFGLESFWEYIFKQSSGWELAATACSSPIWQQVLAIRDEFISKVGSEAEAKRLFQAWAARGKLPLQEVYSIFHGTHHDLRWMAPILDGIVLPKHAFVTTLAAHNALATVDNVCKRGVLIANRCVLCLRAAETRAHLFFGCSYSKDLMQQVLIWQGTTRQVLSLKHELYKLALSRNRSWRSKLARCSFSAAIYFLWQERNLRVFDGASRDVSTLVKRIKYVVCVRMYAWSNGIFNSQLLQLLLG
ncbi:uncharacterized protein LOC141641209 [Silene latifolia]|uniref:uncharacterized protein LOC141641209 n=1 Tax=Silene latifolia TaxID=37657 RepID=UPI003D788130